MNENARIAKLHFSIESSAYPPEATFWPPVGYEKPAFLVVELAARHDQEKGPAVI